MTYHLVEETGSEYREREMALDFFAGCVGGCAGIMVGYPLDTVKVHMQTQDYQNPKYKGSVHCFRTILAKESVAGLYRGMSSPMVGVAAVNAIVFGIYGQSQRHLSEPNSLSSHFLAGVSAGIAQTPVSSPIELAKTRLQLQSPNDAKFTGPMHCLKHIYKKEGCRGVFRGLGITFLREAPSYGVYFVTYEALTKTSSNDPISTPWMLFAGGFAGTASWVISYPIDVIKSRIQAESSNRYSGALDCLRQSIKAEGYRCLYRGLNSTILRAFPTNAATFAVVTWTFRLFGEEENAVAKEKPKSEPIKCMWNEGEPLLGKWNTYLKSVSNEKMLSRSHYSTLSTLSSSSLILGNSASCQVNRYAKVPIKQEANELIWDADNDEEKSNESKSEDGKKKVDCADGVRTVECSFNSSHVINASEFSNTKNLLFKTDKTILNIDV